MPEGRVSIGMPELDQLIEGGLIENSTNLLAGQTGCGKTIFCCQYLLQGALSGQNGVYLTLEEKSEDIVSDMNRFSWGSKFKQMIDNGSIVVQYQTPTDFNDLTDATLRAIRKNGAKRFVLDSLSIASMGWKVSSMDLGKVRSDIFSYMQALKSANVTSLLITEIPENGSKTLSRFGFEEFLVDGVINLHYLEYSATGTPRSLLIRKMRRTNHGTDIYPFVINENGIELKRR
ncbi:hypothetical protein EPN87_04260 [archaeon]|nr:MAG: hypothetical protein EPN87_04260 [archaeon]